MSVKRTAVYPFNDEFSYYLNHSDLIAEYDVVSVISSKGSGFEGISVCLGEKEIIVTEDFDNEVQHCDCVIVIFYDRPFESPLSEQEHNNRRQKNNKILIEKCKQIALLGKEIVCVSKQMEVINALEKYIPAKQLTIFKTPNILDHRISGLQSINTPVVFITCLFEGLVKSDLLLYIYKHLKSYDAKVCCISARSDISLFGGVYMDCFTSSYELSTSHILSINAYLKELEMNNDYDLFLVDVPGGCIPFSKEAPIDFGLTFFSYCKAIYPDYTILLLPFSNTVGGKANELKGIVEKGFGVQIDDYIISNKAVVYQESILNTKVMTISLNKYYMTEEENTYYEEQGNCNDFEKNISSAVDKMVLVLNKYGEINKV